MGVLINFAVENTKIYKDLKIWLENSGTQKSLETDSFEYYQNGLEAELIKVSDDIFVCALLPNDHWFLDGFIKCVDNYLSNSKKLLAYNYYDYIEGVKIKIVEWSTNPKQNIERLKSSFIYESNLYSDFDTFGNLTLQKKIQKMQKKANKKSETRILGLFSGSLDVDETEEMDEDEVYNAIKLLSNFRYLLYESLCSRECTYSEYLDINYIYNYYVFLTRNFGVTFNGYEGTNKLDNSPSFQQWYNEMSFQKDTEFENFFNEGENKILHFVPKNDE